MCVKYCAAPSLQTYSRQRCRSCGYKCLKKACGSESVVITQPHNVHLTYKDMLVLKAYLYHSGTPLCKLHTWHITTDALLLSYKKQSCVITDGMTS